MKNFEWRLYSLVNLYMAGIHAGIQTGHAAVEIGLKYSRRMPGSVSEKNYRTWAEDHKTFVVLDGGHMSNLLKVEELFCNSAGSFPHASFRESEDALNNALTAVAIVVPEWIFKYDVETDNGKYTYEEDGIIRTVHLSGHHILIAKELRKYRLKGA